MESLSFTEIRDETTTVRTIFAGLSNSVRLPLNPPLRRGRSRFKLKRPDDVEGSAIRARIQGFTLYLKTTEPLPESVFERLRYDAWKHWRYLNSSDAMLNLRNISRTHCSAPRTCGQIFFYTYNLYVHQCLENTQLLFSFLTKKEYLNYYNNTS